MCIHQRLCFVKGAIAHHDAAGLLLQQRAQHAGGSATSTDQQHIFARNGTASVAGDVGHQPQAVGVVCVKAPIFTHHQGVGSARQGHAGALGVGGLGRIQLERHGDVAALAAGLQKLLQVCGKTVQRHQAALVVQRLLRECSKAGMDPRGAAVGHGVAHDAVQVGGAWHVVQSKTPQAAA